jgi:hypothetical protein
MKLLSEVEHWLKGTALEFEDPAEPVCQIFARYTESKPVVYDEVLARWQSGSILLELQKGFFMPMGVNVEGPQVHPSLGTLEAFGVEKICPGMWEMTPSLNVPGLIHAFVTLYDVPEAPPWESRIVVVRSLGGL